MDDSPQKLRAKIMYFEYKGAGEIHTAVGVTFRSVNRWMVEWREERAAQTNALVNAIRDKNTMAISDLFSSGVPMLIECLKKIGERVEPLTLKEAKDLTDILCAFDKIQRLDVGKPTEIIQDSKNEFSIEELKKAVMEDPFIEIKGGEDGRDRSETRRDRLIEEET
ncbi:hypothetical protein GOV11_04225 [Candidatus Woesearchaeota archaeon]|nr:hypothetical protein [Candidatus Woesearchaeota archaeon]